MLESPLSTPLVSLLPTPRTTRLQHLDVTLVKASTSNALGLDFIVHHVPWLCWHWSNLI